MSRLELFDGKNILVTGASRGLGREVALRYADTGANLVLVGRDEAKLRKVKQEVNIRGHGTIEIQVCNLEKTEDISRMLVDLNKRMTVDILINCAGIFPISTIGDTSEEEIGRAHV